jgi:putative aldouronate transport system substrate-binding protein
MMPPRGPARPLNNRIDRRSVLKLTGAGTLATAAGPWLVGCGEGSEGGDVGNVGKDLAPWPTYAPFDGPPPDAPGDESGVQPLYLDYPRELVQSVNEPVGDGSVVTAVMLSYGAPPKPVGDNQFWQAINEALDIDLQVTIVPDAEYAEKMATLMASGDDLPDMIMFSNLTLPRRAEFIQASCADLSDLVGGDAVLEYPNLANIPTHAWQGMGRINGRIYGVPLERPRPANSLFVNRTALDEAGITKDWDTDQFVAAMAELTGSRKWGIGGSEPLFGGLGSITYHAGSMGAPAYWRVDNGAFVNTITTPEFEAAIGVMRRVADAGGYYPDSLTISTTDLKTYWYNGTVACMTDGYGAVALDTLTEIDGRFALDLGRPYGPSPTPWTGPGMFGFVTFKQADPERIKLLLRICNYLSAPFGTQEYELANFGLEGVHYTKESGGIETTELYQEENNTDLPVKYLGAAPQVLHLPGYPEAAQAVHEWQQVVLPQSIADPSVGLLSETDSRRGADLNQMVADGISAIVFGRKELSEWQDVVADWKQAGGDQVAEELAEEHAAAS